MKDRVPTKVVGGAIRMEQIDAQGKHLGYIYLRRADEPSEEGTPLNKANMLTDETAEAVGLDPADDPTPNDAFFKLSRLENMQVGDTITTARTIADGRFLACKGQGVSKDDYPELYAAIPERFAFQPTNIAWNAAAITDTSIVYAVGDYYIKLKTSGQAQWQISANGTSGWSDLPYPGRMYYSSGYYLLDSGYICTSEASITSASGWHAITYNSSCKPGSDYVLSCVYEIKSNDVFVIFNYSCSSTTEGELRTEEDADGNYEVYGEYTETNTSYVTEIYAVDPEHLLGSNIDYKTLGTLIMSAHWTHNKRTESYTEDGSSSTSEEYTGAMLSSAEIIESGNYYYLKYINSLDENSQPYKLYLVDPSALSATLELSSAEELYTNPGKNAVFVKGSYISTAGIYPFSKTVYANGTTISLTVPSSKYIFAIGYDRYTNSIVYIVHANNTTSSETYPWSTYIYSLDGKKAFELDSRASLLSSADYAAVLGEDGDGRIYAANYKLVYDLNTSYVLPLYEDNGDAKYMKVSSYIKAEVIDGVLYVRSPFAYAEVIDDVLYADGAFTSAEIENDTLYVQ